MKSTEQISASISDSEIEILQLLWQESPLSAQEMIERVQGDNSNHPRTVKTLINRLMKKGALGFQEKNRKYYYFPTIEKVDFYRIKTETFLNKFFGGEVSPLVSFFSNQNKLNEKEIGELKELIAKIENEESDDDR